VRPGQHRSTRRLRAIVGPDDPGLPATCADLVEDANQVVVVVNRSRTLF
jgi:hypothetical protein